MSNATSFQPHQFPFPDEETKRLWARLEKKLLAIGGNRALWRGSEAHLTQLIERGHLFHEPIKKRRGFPSACHENSAKLWAKDIDRTRICVGYGLSDDGIWRQHTWALSKDTIQETTVVREMYFGDTLTDLEALRFWIANHAAYLGDDRVKTMAELVQRNPRLQSVIQDFLESYGHKVSPKGDGKLAV